MHGIAGAFISGAGLLTLLPIFYRDSSGTFVNLLLDDLAARRGCAICNTSYIVNLWIIPFVFCLIIPIYALGLLIKQLVTIYLVPHGEKLTHIFPRFSLSAIALARDEGDSKGDTPGFSAAKEQVARAWYEAENIALVLPPGENSPERAILRDVYKLMEGTVSINESRKEVRAKIVQTSYQEQELFDFRGWTSGLADRTLVEEAARLEAALTRMNYNLRVTVIRYVKSLLIFIWTAILLSVGVSYINTVAPGQITDANIIHTDPSIIHHKEMMSLLGGIVWATLTPVVASLPIHWLRTAGSGDADSTTFRKDSDLSKFEERVYLWARISVLCGCIGLLIAEVGEQLPIIPKPAEQIVTIIIGGVCLITVMSLAWINKHLIWK